MKRLLITPMLGVMLALGVSPAPFLAQGQSVSPQPGAIHLMTPDEVVKLLAAKLNLTDDQKAQIKPIIALRQQQLQALRTNISSGPIQKMRQTRSIFENSDQKIESVLNDQQKQQYVQLEQQIRQQVRQRMQNHDTTANAVPQ